MCTSLKNLGKEREASSSWSVYKLFFRRAIGDDLPWRMCAVLKNLILLSASLVPTGQGDSSMHEDRWLTWGGGGGGG